jgi:hypothetical protein
MNVGWRSAVSAAAWGLMGLWSVAAHAAPTGWAITDLGAAHNFTTPALNDQGWVVMGNLLLQPGAGGYTSTELFSSAGNANNFRLRDVNNAGVVLGEDLSAGSSTAFVWQAGVRTNLPQVANFDHYVQASARGINDRGQVVGNTGDTAVVWTPNGSGGYQVTPLGVDLGWTIGSGEGAAINNAGAGLMSQVYNSYRTGYSTGVGHTSLVPDQAGYTLVGTAINDSAAVVGYGVYNCGGYSCLRPYVWQGAEFSFLPAIDSSTGISATPRALNEAGQAVGEMYYAGYDMRAVLWTQGPGGWSLTDLNSLNPTGSNFWSLSTATDVNERGQIVGFGSVNGDWRPHAFLLTPAVPEPEAWALALVGVGLVGWRRRGARQTTRAS